MKSTRWLSLLAALMALAASGCGNLVDSDSVKTALTQRQRDSLIARSQLPGAGVVGRALQQSDRASQRAVSLDSLTR